MKNLNLILILVLTIVTFAFARPSPRIMVGTLIKRQDGATDCLCPPSNVKCDSQNLCPATACEAADPPCGTGCCELQYKRQRTCLCENVKWFVRNQIYLSFFYCFIILSAEISHVVPWISVIIWWKKLKLILSFTDNTNNGLYSTYSQVYDLLDLHLDLK
jgi:hypothetical protein